MNSFYRYVSGWLTRMGVGAPPKPMAPHRLLTGSKTLSSLSLQDTLSDGTTGTPLSRSIMLACKAPGLETIMLHGLETKVTDDRAPIVLLAPFTAAHSRQMRRFGEALALRGIRTVALDYPGHGRSGGRRGEIHVEQMMQALSQWSEHFHQRHPEAPIGIVGSSFGGDLAILHALWEEDRRQQFGRPALVQAVYAQAPITPWQREVFSRFRAGMSVMQSSTSWSRLLLRQVIGPRLPITRLFRVADLYRKPALRRAFTNDPQTLRTYDTTSYLNYLRYEPTVPENGLTTPIDIVVGECDKVTPARYVGQVHASLRHQGLAADFEVLPGVGHAPFEENITMLADHVERWVQHRLGAHQPQMASTTSTPDRRWSHLSTVS